MFVTGGSGLCVSATWHKKKIIQFNNIFRYALFWDITQCKVVILYRLFRTTYSSHRRVSKKTNSWPLQMGPICCPEMPVREYHYKLRNNPEGWSSHPLRDGSLNITTLYNYKIIQCKIVSLIKQTQKQLCFDVPNPLLICSSCVCFQWLIIIYRKTQDWIYSADFGRRPCLCFTFYKRLSQQKLLIYLGFVVTENFSLIFHEGGGASITEVCTAVVLLLLMAQYVELWFEIHTNFHQNKAQLSEVTKIQEQNMTTRGLTL